ncbi:MAG: transposase [Deltaproteobacteria bacterium]|nr:transposase [Candidatus Zymogenaceae bacterium]
MARLARVVAPGFPHHVIQRGNRRQQTFFSDEDYRTYLRLLFQYCNKYSVEIWAYCLMPNHVHLVVVPHTNEGLAGAIAGTHRSYTNSINTREEWQGFLWQGRFSSYPMDEQYTVAATRYIEMNPVRAKLVKQPQDWQWSSARAHIDRKEDGLVTIQPLLGMVGNWEAFLKEEQSYTTDIRNHAKTGRPLGSRNFISKLEKKLNRELFKTKPGPKKK